MESWKACIHFNRIIGAGLVWGKPVWPAAYQVVYETEMDQKEKTLRTSLQSLLMAKGNKILSSVFKCDATTSFWDILCPPYRQQNPPALWTRWTLMLEHRERRQRASGTISSDIWTFTSALTNLILSHGFRIKKNEADLGNVTLRFDFQWILILFFSILGSVASNWPTKNLTTTLLTSACVCVFSQPFTWSPIWSTWSGTTTAGEEVMMNSARLCPTWKTTTATTTTTTTPPPTWTPSAPQTLWVYATFDDEIKPTQISKKKLVCLPVLPCLRMHSRPRRTLSSPPSLASPASSSLWLSSSSSPPPWRSSDAATLRFSGTPTTSSWSSSLVWWFTERGERKVSCVLPFESAAVVVVVASNGFHWFLQSADTL